MPACHCGCGGMTSRVWVKGHNRKGHPIKNRYQRPRGREPRIIDAFGYVMIYRPDHPFGDRHNYVREHRLVVEQRIGRFLKKEEVVHHKNGNRQDNTDSNLQLMLKIEHDRLTARVSERCTLESCTSIHKARGLCGSHYGKFTRAGIPFPLPATRRSRWNRTAA